MRLGTRPHGAEAGFLHAVSCRVRTNNKSPACFLLQNQFNMFQSMQGIDRTQLCP